MTCFAVATFARLESLLPELLYGGRERGQEVIERTALARVSRLVAPHS